MQQWGLLAFGYAKANETVDIIYVRVRKPDGAVVVTPKENVQDMPTDVSRAAPMYSDLRQKHVAVKGLSVGDTLEYRAEWHIHTAQIPGQFWTDYDFMRDGIALDEQLQVSVPRNRVVKVKSADPQPVITEEGDRRLYTWKTKNLRRKTEEEKRKLAAKDAPPPAVRITSFHSWEELGNWYAELQRDRVTPTPDIRAKAAELTGKAATDVEKVRALYRYVDGIPVHRAQFRSRTIAAPRRRRSAR